MIHPSAVIDPSAKIADKVNIGPWTLIGADVEIGEGCDISSHVVIKGPTKLAPAIRFISFQLLAMTLLTLNTMVSLPV